MQTDAAVAHRCVQMALRIRFSHTIGATLLLVPAYALF
jgi:hypothetical protein